MNPFECFDVYNFNTWWSDKNFITQNGVQLSAFKRMLERVTDSRTDEYNYGARNIANLDEGNLGWFDAWRSYLAFEHSLEI